VISPRVALLSCLTELATPVALGGVEHREVAPRECELEKLEQERIPVGALRGDAAGELVEVLEPDTPEGEHLANRDALAASCFAGGVEEAAVGPCVGSAALVEPVEHGFVLPGDELLDRLCCHGVI
jgi:hypothetical protein